ncbi:hypothetical protein PRIPAC_73625 [Pristionchus pacificus]|uniref:C2H2-type domain-containing protein n=1 Tax=Pristionchus pacificus TaxID=54126 RepID=A0A2A6C111_PRIPA|nr:hypothetical protein PRIPAC_73625 [Pristionchus pacificus]|eukprot:PDM71711.1 hypothetical protein PRIPAC_38118 [Pristionchus pacificus]
MRARFAPFRRADKRENILPTSQFHSPSGFHHLRVINAFFTNRDRAMNTVESTVERAVPKKKKMKRMCKELADCNRRNDELDRLERLQRGSIAAEGSLGTESFNGKRGRAAARAAINRIDRIKEDMSGSSDNDPSEKETSHKRGKVGTQSLHEKTRVAAAGCSPAWGAILSSLNKTVPFARPSLVVSTSTSSSASSPDVPDVPDQPREIPPLSPTEQVLSLVSQRIEDQGPREEPGGPTVKEVVVDEDEDIEVVTISSDEEETVEEGNRRAQIEAALLPIRPRAHFGGTESGPSRARTPCKLPCGGCASSFSSETERASHRTAHAHRFDTRAGSCAVCQAHFQGYYAYFDHFSTVHKQIYSIVANRVSMYAEMKSSDPIFFRFFTKPGEIDETNFDRLKDIPGVVDRARKWDNKSEERFASLNEHGSENGTSIERFPSGSSDRQGRLGTLAHNSSDVKPFIADDLTGRSMRTIPKMVDSATDPVRELLVPSEVAHASAGPDEGECPTSSSVADCGARNAAFQATCNSVEHRLHAAVAAGMALLMGTLDPGSEAAGTANLAHSLGIAAPLVASLPPAPPPVVSLAYDAPPCMEDRKYWTGKLTQSECPRGCPQHMFRPDTPQNRRLEYKARHYREYFAITCERRQEPERFLSITYGQTGPGHRACAYCPPVQRLQEIYVDRYRLIEHIRRDHRDQFLEHQLQYLTKLVGIPPQHGVLHDLMMSPLS